MSGFVSRITSRTGFTLIELLIVVTIIGTLVALGATSFVRTQKTARDASRRSGVKSMQDALEQYYAANGDYGAGSCGSAGLTRYLPGGIPTDPLTGADVTCDLTGGGADYCVYAVLEHDTEGNCDASCNPDTNGPNFCLKNLQ